MTEPTITQEDREAAMAPEVSRGYTQRTRAKVLRGEKDHDELVQAFARHRTEAAATIAALKAQIERLTELAALMIAEYEPLSHLIGNGCEHGFKPAKACPNEDCRERKLHRALDAAIAAILGDAA